MKHTSPLGDSNTVTPIGSRDGLRAASQQGGTRRRGVAARWASLLAALALGTLASVPAVAEQVSVGVDFPPEDVLFHATAAGTVVRLRDGLLADDTPGTPWLPGRDVTLLVPADAQVRRVVVEGEERLLRAGIDVVPAQPPQPRSRPIAAPVPRNAAAYAAAQRTPAAQGHFTGAHSVRGYSLATVRLNPLRYAPAAKELYLAPRLTVTVVYDLPKARTEAPARHADRVRELVRKLVVNPSEKNVEPARPEVSAQKSVDSALGVAEEDVAPRAAVDYLIITTAALTNAFRALAAHRALAPGLTTKVLSIEAITATYAGTDSQMKIRNCIIDHYATQGTLYVVLGGDDTIVPDRNCYVNAGGEDEYTMPTDLYYSALDGNWNADGDTTYGETTDNVDLGWEVIVARIPVRTAAHATAYINKLVAYETNVPVAISGKLLLGGMRAWNSYTGTARPSDNVTADGHLGFRDAAHPTVSDSEMWERRLYRDGIRPYWTASTLGIFCDTLTSWDASVGGDYLQTAANLSAKFNLGWYHVFFSGHGSEASWGLESGSFTASNASALNNRTAIVYTDACLSGAFDDTTDPCLSEAFLRNANGGALVYIGCSRFGWGTPDGSPADSNSDGGPSTQYGYKFYQRLHGSGDISVGEAFATHKFDMAGSSTANGAYRWIQFGLNFQGEPLFGTATTPHGFAFAEGFENGGSIPAGWTQQYVVGTVPWVFVAGGVNDHPDAAHSGSYNACLFYAGTSDHKTRLVTPAINFGTATENARLEFWHCMEYWPSDQDELRVYYKTSAGGAWNLLATYTDNTAAWTLRTITLPNANSSYYLAFEGNAKYGYGVCIDDVLVTGSLPGAGAATTTTPVPVPYAWLDGFPVMLALAGGDYEVAAFSDTDRDGRPAWQEFVADTDPEDERSVFQATPVVINGQLCLHWTPALTGATPARLYSVYATEDLSDGFPTTPEATLPADAVVPMDSLGASRFFRVGVELQE